MSKCEWCRVEELGSGVYAILDLHGGWFRSNTGLIDMGDYTVVVDTQYNEIRAKDVLRIIEDLDLPPPRLIINTHHHGDHAWGNHVFNVPAVMHENAYRVASLLKDVAPDIYKPFFPQLDFTGAKYTLPEIVVNNHLTLTGSRGELQLYHIGPAHTVGDIIVEVPWIKTVFVGDIVFNKVTPLALDGTLKGWLRTLNVIQEKYRDYTIIGGHGPIANNETLDQLKYYLESILVETEKQILKGITDPLKIALSIKNPPLSDWRENERIVLNIQRAIMDIEKHPPGEPVSNLPELAVKMKKFSRI
ncbi:MAG: MBL fold metallo-hydrolase [Desulfurococcales archaeon]|nr:MBL fold metallo-hydrolase [Desulfurococcales archaeon]